jgi:hypothetical protein
MFSIFLNDNIKISGDKVVDDEYHIAIREFGDYAEVFINHNQLETLITKLLELRDNILQDEIKEL